MIFAKQAVWVRLPEGTVYYHTATHSHSKINCLQTSIRGRNGVGSSMQACSFYADSRASGATVAHLTPDQKVVRSNRAGLMNCRGSDKALPDLGHA